MTASYRLDNELNIINVGGRKRDYVLYSEKYQLEDVKQIEIALASVSLQNAYLYFGQFSNIKKQIYKIYFYILFR